MLGRRMEQQNPHAIAHFGLRASVKMFCSLETGAVVKVDGPDPRPCLVIGDVYHNING